jgi:hypothetical protein
MVLLGLVIFIAGTLTLSAYYPPIKGRDFPVGEKSGGFFSRVINMAAGAHYGETQGAGKIILVNEDHNNQYTLPHQTLMDTYFERVEFTLQKNSKPESAWQHTITKANRITGIPLRKGHSDMFWGGHRDIFPVKSGLPLRVMGDAVSKYIHFKHSIVKKADDWYHHRVNPGAESYIICVHYRGTDTALHFPFEKTDPELYWKRVSELVDQHDDYRLFVATDEKYFANETLVRYPECHMYESPRSDKNDGLHKEGTFDPAYLGQSVIIDALLLARADHLVKGRSNVSEFSLLKNPDMECTVIYSSKLQWYKPWGRTETFTHL